MILFGADNRLPMLDKDLYDSWKSIMELYMQNREHKRMILESIKNGPLIWPTIKENGVTRTKKYVELSDAKKIQADCDMKATNIIPQGTSLTKQERECKLYDAFDKFTHIKGESLHNLLPEWSKFVTDVKLVKDLHTTNFDQLHEYLEQHELHANENLLKYNKRSHYSRWKGHSATSLSETRSKYSGTGYKSNATSFRGNNASGHARVVKCYNCQSKGHMARQCTQPKQSRNEAWYKNKAMLTEAQEARQILDEEELAFLADLGVPDSQVVQTIVPNNDTFETEDLDTYDSDCDDASNAKAVLMANISNYGSDVIS
nr:hypothetical protein [Tanacetum cinerariifolium]